MPNPPQICEAHVFQSRQVLKIGALAWAAGVNFVIVLELWCLYSTTKTKTQTLLFFVDYMIRCKMVSGEHKLPRKAVFLPCPVEHILSVWGSVPRARASLLPKASLLARLSIVVFFSLMSFIKQAYSAKMTGYWPCSLFSEKIRL